MSQKFQGFHKIFSYPFIYSLTQKIMSAENKRAGIVQNIIKQDTNVLDIGCGTGKIIESLPKVNYFGYDISSIYINYAKKKYPNKNFKFFCKKFSLNEIKKLPKFDYVLLFGLMHHLNEKEVIKFLGLIKKVLKKNGILLTCDPVYVKNQNFFAKYLMKNDVGNNIRFAEKYIKIIKKVFKKIKHQTDTQKFIPYNWFVARAIK